MARVIDPPVRPAAKSTKLKPRRESASSGTWFWGVAAYALVLGGLIVFVLKPLLDRSRQPAIETAGGGPSLLEIIDRSEKKVNVATANAAVVRAEQNRNIKAQNSAESVGAMRAAMAKTESERRLLTEAYAQVWFDGDRATGAAMVDARIRTFEKEILAHTDAIDGNEWMYQPGDTVAFDRMWPAMREEPRLASWMAAHQIVDQLDFMWHVLTRSEGAQGATQLPPELAAIRPDSTGTGFWISPDGYLITNQHVVAGAKSIELRLASRQIVPATVVREDATRDLALLKAAVVSPEWLPLTTGQAIQGVDVFTQGFPNVTVQGLAAKFSDGKISSLSGINDDENFYQITVPVQPGNSGGALIHTREGMPWVVGVVSGKLIGGENVNYAIKATVVRAFLGEFPEGQAVLAGIKPVLPTDAPVEHARKASCLLLVKTR